MRSHKSVFALGFVVMVCAGLLLAGCSSDDTPVGGTISINPQYDNVSGEVNDMVDSTIAMVAYSLGVFVESREQTEDQEGEDRFESYLLSGFDTVMAEGDWYVLLDLDLQTAYTNLKRDQFMFLESGVPQVMAHTADAMLYNRSWELAYNNTDDSYNDYNVLSEFNYSGLNTDEGTINGDVELFATIQETDASSSQVWEYTINADFDQLTISETAGEWDTGIPNAGTCDITVDLEYTNGALAPQTTSWTFDITFADGTMTALVRDGTTSRTYTRDL
jgi:hypothetical protein